MQRSALIPLALLISAAAFSSACNDLGSCDDPARGRTTVTLDGQLMFTGQAIINKSCAGCHGSNVKGAGRRGAPAGLDFDVRPIPGGMLVNGALQLDPKALASLRSTQRKVYEHRELIWEQVEKGLMPPKGGGGRFEDLSAIVGSVFGSDGKCTRGTALTDLGASREDFRNWLACDTPVIEATSDQLTYKALPSDSSPADSAAGAGYYSVPDVSVGYQYPACGGDAGMTGGPSFEEVYTSVLAKTVNACVACHGSAAPMGDFDIGTIDKAWTTLMGSGQGGMTQCAAKPVYVKPNDPDNSYLITMVVGSAQGRCTPNVMPLGSTQGLPMAEVDIIRRWIMAGAPRTAAGGGGGDAGASAGGGDAGAADAGMRDAAR